MILSFVLAGLATGAVYGLAGVGLVLTYKTSGVFNFAHGALATIAAFLFYTLHVTHGMPWPIAAFICVFLLGPILGVLLERLARSLVSASLATNVVSTVGVLLIVQAGATLIYGTSQTRTVPPFLPHGIVHLADTRVTFDRILVFVIGLAATAGLYLYFRMARAGVAMRAVVEDPNLLSISGTSPVKVRRVAWIVGSTFASASGVLIVPFISLDATTLTFLIIAAFGAAAIGTFSNLPLTFAGGLGLGIGASLATKYLTTGVLVGLPPALPFLVLFAVLIVGPRSRLSDRARIIPAHRENWTTPWPVQAGCGLLALVALLFVPSFAGLHLDDWTHALAMTILFLSLGLLTRTSGQVSLCHVSFLAIGTCGFSHLAVDHGWPWGLALIAGGLIAVPAGALLAVPAIRLSGLSLALATFGFGVLLQFMFYNQSYMFGALGLGVTVPRPSLSWVDLSGGKGYYYLVLAIAVVVALLVIAINAGRLGRLLTAMADSSTGLSTSGASVNITRLLVFCLSGFLAGIAGTLDAATIGQVNGDSYQPLSSLVFFALIMICFGGAPWYALMAGIGISIIPSYFSGADTPTYLQLAFGVFAVLFACTPTSMRGVPEPMRTALDSVFRRRAVPGAAPETVAVDARGRVRPSELVVSGLQVRFGGLIAVDGVDLRAPTGRITGLIGPNGAGKTTTFDACSGLNRPTDGVVNLDGKNVSHRGPASRARAGLGRTFQQMELFDSLSVRENVELGLEASWAGNNPLRHLMGTPRHRRQARQAAAAAMAACDLTGLADQQVGSLSTGQRRLVELARTFAGPARILLLDEPSSGLDRAETARFGEILRRLVDERGVGVLVVEHDMALVSEICDHIYVLDFGKPIFDGAPVEVMNSPLVQAAYLGEQDVHPVINSEVGA